MATIKKRDHRSSEVKIKTSEAYERFLLSRKSFCSVATVSIYREKQNQIVDNLSESVNDITADELRDWFIDYRNTHNAGGTHRFYSIVRAFLHWVWDEYEIDTRCPIDKVKVKMPEAKPIKGITREEIEKIFEAIKVNSRFPERDMAFISLLADTGLRKSSVCNLKMKDIDLSNNQLLAFEKDQRWHSKSFGTKTGRLLKNYLNCLDGIKRDDPLWLNIDSTAMTADSARQMLQRMEDFAGIPRHQFHAFRRFYGLELYNLTGDIYFVSRMLDHKNIEVTKRYLAIDDMEDLEKMRTVSPMDNKKYYAKKNPAQR